MIKLSFTAFLVEYVKGIAHTNVKLAENELALKAEADNIHNFIT